MDTAVIENNKESYIGNLVLPIAILGLSAICFIQSLTFPTNEDVGPAAVPFSRLGLLPSPTARRQFGGFL